MCRSDKMEVEDQFKVEQTFGLEFESVHQRHRHEDPVVVRRDLPVPITVSDLDSDAEFFVTSNGTGKAQFLIWCHTCQKAISSASAKLVDCGCFLDQRNKSSSAVAVTSGQEQRKNQNQIARTAIISEIVDVAELKKLPRFFVEIVCFFIITMIMFEVWILLTGEHFAAFLNP